MRNHACEDQRQPEGKHDRPNCRGGKLYGSCMCLSGIAITILIVSLHHGIDPVRACASNCYRPSTYTTRNTTTHTASTKCQKSDSTSSRSACISPSRPLTLNRKVTVRKR